MFINEEYKILNITLGIETKVGLVLGENKQTGCSLV